MKNSTMIILVFSVVLVIFALASFNIYTENVQMGHQVRAVSVQTEKAMTENFELAQIVKDIKFDVVQVQQWLTDISATRGLDGLDDGKTEAAEYADRFKEDVGRARELADKLDLQKVKESLDGMEKAFPPYYQTGIKMADAYIGFGAEGGNKMMASFDAVAEEMSKSVDNMTEVVEDATGRTRTDLLEKVRQTDEMVDKMRFKLLMVFTAVSTVLVLTCAFLALFLRSRAKQTQSLIQEFEETIHAISSNMNTQASGLLNRATTMSSTLEKLSDRTETTSRETTEVSGHVQFVASATEELSISISQIGSDISKSSEVVRNSSVVMDQAQAASSALKEAVSSISGVLEMIDGIAGQISMLALNATIESARAGEAGKGFAVVAGEVKNLAVETTKATGLISTKIAEVTQCSEDVTNVVISLEEVLGDIEKYSNAIVGAIEQQDTATQEIAHRMGDVSVHTQKFDESLQFVSATSKENHSISVDVYEAANQLKTQSSKLMSDVERFLLHIRKVA